MIQFCGMIGQACYLLYHEECKGTRRNLTLLYLFYIISMLALFMNFSINTYSKKSGKANKAKLKEPTTKIEELNVTNNASLVILECYNNSNLSILKLGNNNLIQLLSCYNTKITELDVSKLERLTQLKCYTTDIEELDVNIKVNKISLIGNWVKYGKIKNKNKFLGLYNDHEFIHEISAGIIGPEIQSIWDQQSIKQKVRLLIELENRSDVFDFERDMMIHNDNWQLSNINRIII